MLETRIRAPCLVGDREAQLLVVGPPGRGSVVVADIQHNVWVILLSQ